MDKRAMFEDEVIKVEDSNKEAGFFDGVFIGHDDQGYERFDREYDADSLTQFLTLFFSSGVFRGKAKELYVEGLGSNRFRVLPGTALVEGRFFRIDEPVTHTVNQVIPGIIDTVVVQVNKKDRDINLVYRRGEKQGIVPAIIRDGNIFEIRLSNIHHMTGGYIVVKDQRHTEDCGSVTIPIEEIDVTTIVEESMYLVEEALREMNHEIELLLGEAEYKVEKIIMYEESAFNQLKLIYKIVDGVAENLVQSQEMVDKMSEQAKEVDEFIELIEEYQEVMDNQLQALEDMYNEYDKKLGELLEGAGGEISINDRFHLIQMDINHLYDTTDRNINHIQLLKEGVLKNKASIEELAERVDLLEDGGEVEVDLEEVEGVMIQGNTVYGSKVIEDDYNIVIGSEELSDDFNTDNLEKSIIIGGEGTHLIEGEGHVVVGSEDIVLNQKIDPDTDMKTGNTIIGSRKVNSKGHSSIVLGSYDVGLPPGDRNTVISSNGVNVITKRDREKHNNFIAGSTNIRLYNASRSGAICSSGVDFGDYSPLRFGQGALFSKDVEIDASCDYSVIMTSEDSGMYNGSGKNNTIISSYGSEIRLNCRESSVFGSFKSNILDSSYSSIISSEFSSIRGAEHSTILGSYSASISSRSLGIYSYNSVILASRSVDIYEPNRVTMMSSYKTNIKDGHDSLVVINAHNLDIDEKSEDNDYSYQVIGGKDGLKWRIDSNEGDIEVAGQLTGSSNLADFAEYMESENGEKLPLGSIVAKGEGQKIRVAKEGDYPLGVISETAGLILNAQGMEWEGKYLYDRYGQPIYVERTQNKINKRETEKAFVEAFGVEFLETEEYRRIINEEEEHELVVYEEVVVKERALNPEYDPEIEYIPRNKREEWNIVGMKGQIYVNVDKDVEEGDFIQAGENGIGVKGNDYNQNWIVMEITTPYSEELGHAIARVLI